MNDENLLAINIGNTRTHLGTFVSGKLEAVCDIENDEGDAAFAAAVEQAYNPLRHADPCYVLLASVNPSIESRVIDGLSAHVPHEVFRVERDIAIPVGRQLDPESLVGDDRLLNVAAAYDVLKQACVVVDAGTAITIDFIDGAGTFHGGAIGPGAQLMLDSLHEHTQQLPEVEFNAPVEVIGHNTSEAMLTATYHGLRGMVRELVEQFAERAGTYPMVIATGGDAHKLFADYELIERVVPDLTLHGMAVTLRKSLEAQAEDGDGRA